MKALTLVLLIAVAAGCSRRERPVETAVPQADPAVATPTAGTNDAEATAAAEAARREAERRRAVLEERVQFEFDSSVITDEARAVLDRKLPILSDDATIRLRIGGHADERGSVEYNLALSLRRANAVRAYLAGAGIVASRLEVAGFGEEQPIETGTNESAWAANRRAEFSILSSF